jgi:1,4-dihydroxy-2-naphthoate octaprenyltransferase
MSGPNAPPTRPIARREVWVRMLLYPRHTLPTAVAPVLVAAALAWRDGCLAPAAALAAFGAGWLVQLGGVFTDNYFNLRRHPDDREHAAFVQALAQGVITLGQLRRAIAACYVVAMAVGLYLVAVGGLPALAIGLLAIAASLAYSAGPYPLGDHALGDPLFFATFGVLSVMGSYYVQAAAHGPAWPLWPPPGALPLVALWASLPVAALTTNILVIDNIRDREYDRSKGEVTLAVLLGRRGSLVEYGALLALAYAVPPALWAWGGFGPALLLPLASLPYGLLVAWRVAQAPTHDALVPMTPQAGQVLLAHSALFALGLAW